MVFMVEPLVKSRQLIPSRLLGFLSAVQPLYAILCQGPPDGHLLGKATGAVCLRLHTDMEVGCPLGLAEMGHGKDEGHVGEVPLKVYHPLAVYPLILGPQLGLAF